MKPAITLSSSFQTRENSSAGVERMDDSQQAKPKRGWGRIGLRALLLALLLGVVLPGLAWRWVDARSARAKRHREAPARIRDVEARILLSLSRRRPNSPPPRISVWHRPPGWLEQRFGDPGPPLCSLDAKGTQFGDREMAYVKGLVGLRDLDLIGTEVGDAGLARLEGLASLRNLILDGTRVTDAGLIHLEGLANLERLELPRTQVTDAGLKHIEGLTRLECLLLGDLQSTDAGLEHLRRLTRLRTLVLAGSGVGEEGVEKLRQALPDCEIYRR